MVADIMKITARHIAVLIVLSTYGAMTALQLQEELAIGRSAVSKRLVDLKSAGLVQPESLPLEDGERNRPRLVWHLTELGVAEVDSVRGASAEQDRRNAEAAAQRARDRTAVGAPASTLSMGSGQARNATAISGEPELASPSVATGGAS